MDHSYTPLTLRQKPTVSPKLGLVEGGESPTNLGTALQVPRNKIFHVNGRRFEDYALVGLPFFPPKQKIYDMFFFRQLYDLLQHSTYSSQVHFIALRTASVKLMEMQCLPNEREISFFGNCGVDSETIRLWFTWEEFCEELIDNGHPQILLNHFERLWLLVSDRENSILSCIWFYFITTVTAASCANVVCPEMSVHLWSWAFPSLSDAKIIGRSSRFQDTCCVIFSIEFFIKVLCLGFVRMEVVDRELRLAKAADQCPNAAPMPRAQVFLHFARQAYNILDFLVIFPFWLRLLAGDLHLNAALLRSLRMFRILRLVKSAHNMDLLQVLGLTLWNSIRIVIYLFVIFAVVAVMAGVVLNESEEGKQFASVAEAFYWILTRLLAVTDVPYSEEGRVVTTMGVSVMFWTMGIKSILWIVPIAQIKEIFQEQERRVSTLGTMRNDMNRLLTSKGENFGLLSASCARFTMHLLATHCSTSSLSQMASYVQDQQQVEGVLPLPILKGWESVVEDHVVIVLPKHPGGVGGSITFSVHWRPDGDMLNQEYPHMPKGVLKVQVTDHEGFHAWEGCSCMCNIDVPITAFALECKSCSIKIGDHVEQPLKWEINWMGDRTAKEGHNRHAKGRHNNTADPHKELVFRKETMILLKEQGLQVQRNSQLISENAASIAEQKQMIMRQGEQLARIEDKLDRILNRPLDRQVVF